MESKKLFMLILLNQFLVHQAYAQKFVSGAKSVSASIDTIGMIVGPAAMAIAGLMWMIDRQRGAERTGAVVIGAMVFGGATSIFTFIYQAFR